MKRALIVVDMLHDFVAPDGALTCGEAATRIVPYVAELVQALQAEGQPVFFICDAHDPDDIEFRRFPVHCVAGTPGARVVAPLDRLLDRPGTHQVFKKRYSGFYGTDLAGRLAAEAPERVDVVGVCTNICVLYTVEELCNRDIPVAVHERGVASFDEAAHRFALEQMRTVLGAEIV